MAGRAGLGLAQGFMQGYDFMQRIDEREQRMGLRDQQAQRADESHQWRGEQVERQREEWQRADDQRLVQSVYQGLQSGQLDPDLAEEYGKRFDVDWGNYLDPEFGNSLQVLEKTAAGEGYTLRDPEFKQAFGRVFSREIGKGNGERYQGEDGEYEIAEKSVRGVYPGPDGQSLMVDLDILERGPNGDRRRNAPVTTNRSANDDEVKQIPLEAALQKLKGHQLMYNAVQNDPQLQSLIKQHAARVGAQLPQQERVKGMNVNGRLVDPYTGEVMADLRDSQSNDRYGDAFEHPQLGWVQPGPDGRLHQLDPPGSSSKAPADIQAAEWLMANGVARTPSEAYGLVSTSKTNPSSFISSYVSAAARNQDEYDPNRKSMQELTEEARQVYDQIVAPQAGLNVRQPVQDQQAGTGQPAGLQMLNSSAEALPDDGSAVAAPEGGMQGRVNLGEQPSGQPQQDMSAQQQAEQIRADYRAGNITREQAVSELRRLGFE